ncbi:MAG TPA: PfaD family polyunsaturated fatty acid/polyketide biosynthesis protein [Anaerolineaceae bacterium]|nr:PfaD family polyunsaturated fatty acid/polyketide biosynthesis protein [Anaerolineaceae bacterium]
MVETNTIKPAAVLHLAGFRNTQNLTWQGPHDSIAYDQEGIRKCLLDLDQPVYLVGEPEALGVTRQGRLESSQNGKFGGTLPGYMMTQALPLQTLGDPDFISAYGTRYAYYGGSMANGISSEQMVIELGKAGFLGSYGAAGMTPARVEAAIQQVQKELPEGPYAFNLINSPNEPALEHRAVDLYLKYGVTLIEASAYLDITPALVYYRVAGLSQTPAGQIQIKNRVIAKISRKEVASLFMSPAPQDILNQLVAEKKISELQAGLAHQVPMADDVTVEADSGGHTDNRPLVCLLPTMIALRDELQEKFQYAQTVRIGAAGGISTPSSALAAFIMGAAYVVTGSVNQACVESNACEYTKKLLAQADMADVIMAPAADMFEMGVKVQLLKRGTLFPMRAQKLFELYTHYNSIEEIPLAEREKLEKQVFKRSLETVWQDTVKFFEERDPEQIKRANGDPHRKMALVFRWYLGLSSRWSSSGEKGREMDYQIWCGPSMGTFNDWTRGSYLAEPQNRHVVDVACHILTGCAYLYRLQALKLQGLRVAPALEYYRPEKPL